MSHERLRQLHANASDAPWTWAGTHATLWLLPPGTPSPIPEDEAEAWAIATIHGANVETAIALVTLRNALPQLANLALTAETLLRYYAGRDEPILDSLRDALTDLEEALNPTRNTQSQA